MLSYHVRPLIDLSEKEIFKNHYELISGLPLPDRYLHTNQVFGLIHNNMIIGGFILSADQPLRTYRMFANETNWPGINSRLAHLELCEISCLWLTRKYWNWFATSLLWFNAARIVSRRKEDLVIFGTVSRGNKMLYGSIHHAQLIHHDLIDIQGNKKNSWIYAIPVKWFFIDIIRKIAVRFYQLVLKSMTATGAKYLRKHLGINPSIK